MRLLTLLRERSRARRAQEAQRTTSLAEAAQADVRARAAAYVRALRAHEEEPDHYLWWTQLQEARSTLYQALVIRACAQEGARDSPVEPTQRSDDCAGSAGQGAPRHG